MAEYGDQRQRTGDIEPSTPVDASGVLAELVDEAVVRLDTGGTIKAANSRFAVLTGKTESTVVGSQLSAFVNEADTTRLESVIRGIRTQPQGTQTTLGVSLQTDDELVVACQLSLAVATGRKRADGEIIGTVRPVDTADAELQRRASQQAAVATVGQLALESDDLDELMFESARLVGETLDCAYCKVLDLDVDRQELLLRQGVGWHDGIAGTATVDSDTNSQAGYTLLTEQPVIVDDLDTETRFTGPELLTSHNVTSGISAIIGSLDEPWGIVGVHDTRHRQFTEDDANFVQSVANVLASAIDRYNRTQELTQYERIIETVNDGVYMVDPEGRFTMVNEAYCELTGYDRDRLVGAETSLVVDKAVRSEAVELEAEMRNNTVDKPSIEAELRTADGETRVVEATFALLTTGDRWQRVGVVRDISERRAYERRLERNQTELTALNEVNAVVREITNAILDQSTRREIEQLVCDSLAAFDSYRFAWIGEVDSRSRTIKPRVEAGVKGYLEDVVISIDPTDPMSRGPAGRAVETQTLQVSQNVFTDPQFEPWRDVAEAYDYRSLAVIPIRYEGTLYCLLGLYSDAVDAFAEEKQAIIQQLGEVVGHAIAAVERKQALMGDTVTELEFEIPNVFSVDNYPEFRDGEVTLDRVIPVGGESYLQYGRATTELLPTLQQLERQEPTIQAMTILEEFDTEVVFEMRVTEPPITSIVADTSGSIKQATIRDNQLRVVVHLPQTTSVRSVLSRIRETRPNARPVARRQVTRSEASTHRLTTTWTDELTDRQRASLEAAYFAGFFEWPRNSSGTDLAESMAVSPATFHQHLRTAERKLFGVLFDD